MGGVLARNACYLKADSLSTATLLDGISKALYHLTCTKRQATLLAVRAAS